MKNGKVRQGRILVVVCVVALASVECCATLKTLTGMGTIDVNGLSWKPAFPGTNDYRSADELCSHHGGGPGGAAARLPSKDELVSAFKSGNAELRDPSGTYWAQDGSVISMADGAVTKPNPSSEHRVRCILISSQEKQRQSAADTAGACFTLKSGTTDEIEVCKSATPGQCPSLLGAGARFAPGKTCGDIMHLRYK